MNSRTRINSINVRFAQGDISIHEKVVLIHAIIGMGVVHGDYPRNGQRHWDIAFPNIAAAYSFLQGVIAHRELDVAGNEIETVFFDGFINGKDKFTMNTTAVVTLTEIN